MTFDVQWNASSLLVNNINVYWHENILMLRFHEEVAKCTLTRFQVLNIASERLLFPQILEPLALCSAPTNALFMQPKATSCSSPVYYEKQVFV